MPVLALLVKSVVSTSGVAALEDGRLGTGDYHDFKPLHNPQTYMGPIVIESQFELEDGRKKCADPRNTSKLLDCMMCPPDEQCCAAKYSPAHGVGCTNSRSAAGTETIPNQGSRAIILQQSCRGSFSVVSKPIPASKFGTYTKVVKCYFAAFVKIYEICTCAHRFIFKCC